jgi:membrane-bound ClpP family serine protease
MNLRIPTIASLLAFWLSNANAAIYVDKVDHPRKVVILKIEGRIKYEDEIEFQRTLDEIKRDGYKIKLNSVVLNTRGGNSNAAMEIGKIIRKRMDDSFVTVY